MANRNKKIPIKNIDKELEEVDNTYLVTSDPRVKDVPIGEHVYINLPMFSRRLRLYRQEQKDKGLLSNEQYDSGCIYLNDGRLLEPNKTYDVELTPEIKQLLKFGILRGGGRMRTSTYRPRMITISREEEEKLLKITH